VMLIRQSVILLALTSLRQTAASADLDSTDSQTTAASNDVNQTVIDQISIVTST